MKQYLELDLIISHPEGITENLKRWIKEGVIASAEGLGCEVGGSFTLVDEVPEQ